MKKKNLDQEKAICFKDGPCLVISGPGSGKTYVITNRICKLIEDFNVDPRNILVITFTRAAADEMKSRFLRLARERKLAIESTPIFGTFHSVFYEILRREFGYSLESLITRNEAFSIINGILQKSRLYKIISPSLMLKYIDEYKLAKEREERYIPDRISEKQFLKVYKEYENKLYDLRKLDFSDMIDKCYELLSCNKKVLLKYQSLFKYILVDEFQDINKSQYNLVRLICKSSNIFVVGDDDQSIYSFRGSMPGVMRDFLNDYRGAIKISLDTNYRSKANIVEVSKRLIDCNRQRFRKRLRSDDSGIGNIEVKRFVDSRDEDAYIVNKLKSYIGKGFALRDMAILYRTNQLANSLVQDLEKNGIRCKVKTDARDNDDDAVSLMTFHLSKGLEFKIVFIVDANDGITPHKKSIKDYEVETERRLFYVAMTRAKSNLHIYFTVRRFGKKYMASRFILEALGDSYGKER